MPNLIYMFPEFRGIDRTDPDHGAGLSACISLVFGIVFGLILVVTREGDILENKIVYTVLGKIIDLFFARFPSSSSIMVLSDVTKFVSGTSIGLQRLVLSADRRDDPFFARQIEQAIAEI